MFKRDKLRALVAERLEAAAEEILRLFEQTLSDYEEEAFLSRRELEPRRRRRPAREASLQISVRENDGASEPERQRLEKSADAVEDEREPQRVKEEREEELWPARPGERHEEADTKETMFNIVYVQRSDEEGRCSPHESKEAPLCSGLSGQLKAESDRGGCGAAASASDDSDDDCGRVRSGKSRKKPQRAGEAADRPYTCGVCNKNFRIKSILTRHMKTHTGDKPHSCGVCGKNFIQRSYLQTHMNSHSGQRPYACSFCGRGFTQVGNMNAHMRIHTGEKPHGCADCGKSFREKADLVKHAIIHTGEKPYRCTVCAMRFSAQSNLTRHRKTHSGDRPYSCAACGKRFIRRSHLIIHMKTHAGESL